VSKLRLGNGDDHPEAAGKHLSDARVLLPAGRVDGAAYLAGYVIECALKSLWLHERGVPPSGKPAWKAGRTGHEISELRKDVATLAAFAGARIARYVGPAFGTLATAQIAAWNPTMRYQAPSMNAADATIWVAQAQALHDETIGEMLKDGVI
jgi:hypothetical protein